jgi:peptide/nickel transport system substrate-binding protein
MSMPVGLRRRAAALGAAALTAVAASAAFGAGAGSATALGASEADEPTTFTVGITNEVDSFNPFLGIEAESFEMWALAYDYLISYSMEDMSLEPGLATSWDTSEDGLTWTFTVREGVTWSDGEQLTAEDVAFTYNRILDGGPEAASWGSYLAKVETITAPDDTTVVLELKRPNSVLPLLPIPILPEHVWSDIDEEQVKSYPNEPGDGPVVGSGPYRLVEGSAGGSLYEFEANPDYWKAPARFDRVVFRVYQAEDPMVQALVKGEIDFAEGVSPLQIEALERQPGITTSLGTSPGFDEISFNAGSVDLKTGELIGDPNPAVLDPAFRYALGFALDRELIAERVYQGAAEPGTTIVPSAYAGYHWEPPEDVAFTFDLERAAELLDEAGYTVGDDGLRTMPDGSPIGTLRFLGRSDADNDASVATLQYFSEWLEDIGIRAEVSAMESSKLTNVIYTGEFDAFQWGWYVEPDPNSMLDYMTCAQRNNWSDSWYCNEEYDRIYEQQQSELDPEARTQMIHELQEILYTDAPYLVTAYTKIGEAYRSDRLESGFTPQPTDGGILLFQYGVHNYLDWPEDQQQAAPVAATRDEPLSAGTVMGAIVVGLLVFLLGAGVGGWAGYRRATVDYRE